MPITSGLVNAPAASGTRSRWGALAGHQLIVALVWLALRAWAVDREPAAEALHLSLLALAVLQPAAIGSALRRNASRAALFYAAALFAVLVVVATPAGMLRALAFQLPVFLALAALTPERALLAEGLRARAGALVLLVVGGQLALRLGALGPLPTPATPELLRALVWPVLTALGLVAAEHAGAWRRWTPWVAAGALFVVGGGFGVASTCAAWTLASGAFLRRGWRWPGVAALALAGGLAAMASPALAALLGLALWAWWTPRRWLPVTVVVAGALALVLVDRPWREVTAGVLLLHLALPTVLPLACGEIRGLGRSATRRDTVIWLAFAGTVLGVAALRFLPASLALPMPALLLVCGLERRSSARSVGPALALWSAVAVLLANLPLLRGTHLLESLPTIADRTGPIAALLVLTAASLAGGWSSRFVLAGRLRPVSRVAGIGLPIIGFLALAGAPSNVLLSWPPTTLDRASPSASWELTPGAATTIQIDGFLANSATLPIGETVAEVSAFSSGEVSMRAPLRTGIELGDWAADAVGLARPASFLSWIADGGFYGHRYRVRLPLPPSTDRVAVDRLPGIPESVSLTLHAVSVDRR